MIKEVAKFIEERTAALTFPLVIGTTLSVGRRTQDDLDRCAVVLTSSGGSTYFDLKDRADLLVQVIHRGKKQMQTYDDARELYGVLHGYAGWDLPVITLGVTPEYVAMTIEALATPQYIGTDEKRRHEFSCNFIFRIRDK